MKNRWTKAGVLGGVLVLSIVFSMNSLRAAPSDLLKSYQQEIAFLKSHQKELKARLSLIERESVAKTRQAKRQLDRLEARFIGVQVMNDKLGQKLTELERERESKEDLKSGLEGIVKFAFGENRKVDLEDKVALVNQVDLAFSEGLKDLQSRNSVREENGSFFNAEGKSVEGRIVHFGSVAKFGFSGAVSGPLYPVGDGYLKLWTQSDVGELSKTPTGRAAVRSVFLSDDFSRAFEKKKEKSLMSVLEAGGYIGYFICLLGAVAFVLSIVRYFLLGKKAQFSPQRIGRLVKDNIDEARDKIEDIVAEGIIRESQVVDRFGTVILVVASVAPLLGLLGTVTGMISTFDRITEFGTGNPRLLSGGISEALVTTMLGLVVAIPTLLLGQYLNSKSEGIKDEMERVAFEAMSKG